LPIPSPEEQVVADKQEEVGSLPIPIPKPEDELESQGPDVSDSGATHDPSQITDPSADQLSKGGSETPGEE
jgi:hypothetical protein